MKIIHLDIEILETGYLHIENLSMKIIHLDVEYLYILVSHS